MTDAEILGNLERFLRREWHDAGRISVANMSRVLGGWSKRMYAVDVEVTDYGTRASIPMMLRINAPEESAILRNSRSIEHILLQRLKEHTPLPVPRSYLVDRTGEYFGAEAMLLERLSGNPRISTLPECEIEGVATHLIELMAKLHTTPVELLNGDGALSDPNGWNIKTDNWDDYIDSSCRAWRERYADIAFDALPIIYDGFHWLQKNKPRPLPLVMLHGELNPNNLITDNGRIVGLIDWERPHIGDPREDLAWLRYFERTMAGTRLVESIREAGGYLGYYNKLTGFGVTEEELDYFTIFSHSDVSYGPYSFMRRGFLGEHSEIMSIYFLAEPICAQRTYPRILGYPVQPQGH